MSVAPYDSDPAVVVLHALRCIGHASLARIAAAAQLSESDTESELIDAACAGLATYFPGPFGGWAATEEGRRADAERVEREVDQAGARPAIRRAYARFLELNPDLLDVCTSWQLRPIGGARQVNDHSDFRYDSRLLRKLAVIDENVQAVCADLAATMQRFGAYGPRLARARERVLDGDGVFFTDHTDSYHTVWFQLHEDLLATLGMERF